MEVPQFVGFSWASLALCSRQLTYLQLKGKDWVTLQERNCRLSDFIHKKLVYTRPLKNFFTIDSFTILYKKYVSWTDEIVSTELTRVLGRTATDEARKRQLQLEREGLKLMSERARYRKETDPINFTVRDPAIEMGDGTTPQAEELRQIPDDTLPGQREAEALRIPFPEL